MGGRPADESPAVAVAGPISDRERTAEIEEQMRHVVGKEAARQRAFGHVRPVISVKDKDHRLVVVGSRIYFHKEWRNFTDFLLFYIHDMFGGEWWQANTAKPLGERHPVLKWHAHMLNHQDKEPDERGLVSAPLDGTVSAFLLLAYDLYVLKDHSKLQDIVVERLRHPDQFQGARYELFVAATFIRAGLDIAYEDETDATKKHAEFVATHRESGLTLSVEAKARQRKVSPASFEVASIRPGVRDLLKDAAEKASAHPLVVFLEVNIPSSYPAQPPSWVPHVDEVVQEVTKEALEKGGPAPFGLTVFTNRPHIYGEPGGADQMKEYCVVRQNGSPISLPIIQILVEAVTQYGNVPTEFPSEFREAVDCNTPSS